MNIKQISVGLTGGIGSGKSFVAKLFEMEKIPVYNADERSKYLLNHNPEIKKLIEKNFGSDIYLNGELDRKRLASVIFNDAEKRSLLESISHPAVLKDFGEWKILHREKKIILKEAALIYEAGTHIGLDKIIVVAAPLELRIKRVMKRDGISRGQVISRIKSQWPEEEKIARADYVIYNDEKQLLIPQVLELIKSL